MKKWEWQVGLALALAAGCGHGPRAVTDEDPADKIPAIEQAVGQHNHRVLPQLVKDLQNDDPAVRMYAIEGLRRLTNLDFGYRYYEDAEQRQAALQRWQKWLSEH
jgi:hypothetical protein